MCPTADLVISMARRYYRRRTVTVRPKKKWATNLTQGNISSASGGTPYATLVQNTAQTSSPTPIIIKCGNFKIQGDVSVAFNTSRTSSPWIALLVFFLPEGTTLNGDTANAIVENHPEWILAWKQLDVTLSTTSASQIFAASGFSFSSRLKRNLNSGDKICMGFTNDDGQAFPTIKFTAQYWTCAN